MLQAIFRGEKNPKALAALASRRLKCTQQDLEHALEGRYDEHLQGCLRELLEDLEALDRGVAAVELGIGQLTTDHREVIARLCTLRGIDVTTAQTILAEIGTDMSQFPDARHLASYNPSLQTRIRLHRAQFHSSDPQDSACGSLRYSAGCATMTRY